MDELEQAIVEFGWHPDEIKPRDKTWLHERRNWIRETENLRLHLRTREDQVKYLTKQLVEAQIAVQDYWEAWQDAAIYWKGRVAAMERVLHAARKWRDQYCVNVERGITGLMRGDELVAILEEYDFNREKKVP